MADIVGVLAFALHTTHRVFQVVQKMKGAPDTIRALERETLKVKTLLTSMLSSHDGVSFPALQNTSEHLLRALIEDAEALTSSVDAFFNRTTQVNVDGIREAKRVRWLLRVNESRVLSERFKVLYSSLSAVHAVSTSYVINTNILDYVM